MSACLVIQIWNPNVFASPKSRSFAMKYFYYIQCISKSKMYICHINRINVGQGQTSCFSLHHRLLAVLSYRANRHENVIDLVI